MAAPTTTEEVQRVAALDDATIDSLYPQYKEYVRLLRTEGLDAVGRILHGEHKPQTEYSAQRARLLGQLARLDDIEGRLREEREKTGRTSYMMASQLAMAILGLEKSIVSGSATVEAAQVAALTKRIAELDKSNRDYGPVGMEALDPAAIRAINAIGAVASGGKVTDGVAFADNVKAGLDSITDARKITPFLQRVQEQTGVPVIEWLMSNETNVPMAPVVSGALDRITDGQQADAAAYAVKAQNDQEAMRLFEEATRPFGGNAGVRSAKALGAFQQLTGISPLATTGVGGRVSTTTTTPADAAKTVPETLDETRKRINDELDRLANGTDSVSTTARKQLLASSDLAQWADRNGYSNFRPEQQLRAFVAFAKKRVEEQDDAFRAKLDADILGGRIKAPTIRGEVINQVGARVREAVRGIGRPGADLTGGAKGPEDTAPKIPESTARDAGSEPTAEDMAKKETSDDVFVGEIERSMEDVPSRTGPAVTSVQALRGSTTAPEKPRSNIEQMLATRPQNEAAVQRVLNNPTYSWAKPEYEKLQALKSTDPVGYATGLDELAVKVRKAQEPQRRLGVVRTPGERTPLSGTLGDYDANKNGMIDDDELALMEKSNLPPPTGEGQKPETVPLGTPLSETDAGAQLQTERDLDATVAVRTTPAPETRTRRGGFLRRLLGRDAEAAPTPAPAPVSTSPVEPTAPVEAVEAPAPAPAPVPAAPTVTRTAAGAGGFEYAELSDGTIKITKDKSGPADRVVDPGSKAYTAIKAELDKTAPAPAPAPAPSAAPTPAPTQAPAPTQPSVTFGELAPETPPGFQPTTASSAEAKPSPDLAKSPFKERTEQRPILPTFKSFGAEAATSQAQQAMDSYQQMLAERRARRRQMLGIEPDPGLYEMGLRR